MEIAENFSYDTSGDTSGAPSLSDMIDSARMQFRAKYDRATAQIGTASAAAEADSEFSVPHHLTFAAVWNWVQKYYYSYYDESQIDSLQNSLAMRRDGFIQELLWHRQMPVTGLTYAIEVDDPDDPGQVQFRKCLERVVNRLPYFKRMQIQLLESIFYGKSGVQVKWGRKKIAGREYVMPVKHIPVQGDKINLGFADVPAIYIWPGSQLFKLPQYSRYIRNIQLGPAFMLEEQRFRDNFVIHQFQPADADYLFEGEKAGGIQGQGIRDRFYWTWNIRQQVLMWYLNALERVGVNGMLYGKYPTGNPRQQAAVLQALANLISTNVAAFPYTMGSEMGDMIGQIPPSPVGYDVMYQLLTHLEGIMRRGVLGQNLSSKSEPTGMNSNVADLAGEAKEDVVLYDAGCLAETLDDQLIQNIVKLNTWEYNGVWYYGDDLPFGCRYTLQTDRRNVGELIASAEALWRMGVPLDMDDLRERAGLKAPRSASTALVQMGGITGATPNRQAVQSSIGSPEQKQNPERFASADEIDRIALLIDPDPTDPQKKAGNYRKAHTTVHGLPITIETARGRVRSGVSPTGKPWSVDMAHHYGYIKRTESEADQDHIDVFIGRHPESQLAFVVDQIDPASGRFDEHKCMLGFRNEQEAKCGYLDCYSPGWKGLGAISPVLMHDFKKWCYEGDTSRPFCDQLHARLGGFVTGGPPFLLGHASNFVADDLPELFNENPCGDGGGTHGFHEGNTCQEGGSGGGASGGGMTQKKRGGVSVHENPSSLTSEIEANFPEGPRRSEALEAARPSKWDQVSVSKDEHGKVNGIVSYWKDPDSESGLPGEYIRVRNMATAAPGLGREVLKSVAEYADSKGAGLSLNTLADARGFYEKLGFKEGSEKGANVSFYMTNEDVKNFISGGNKPGTTQEKGEATGKQFYEMTKDEFINKFKDSGKSASDLASSWAGHVSRAVLSGKTIPDAVKAEYSDRQAGIDSKMAAALKPVEITVQSGPIPEKEWKAIKSTDKDDDYLYHVTTKANAAKIMRSKTLKPGAAPTIGKGNAYEDYSKGNVFLTERSGVPFWTEKVQSHYFHNNEKDAKLSVIRIPKSVAGDLEKDKLGSDDARAGAYMTKKPVRIADGPERLSSFDLPELFSAAHSDPGDPGVMIALMVPEETAGALALPDGVPTDQLHVTLAYLGRLSEIGEESVEKLRAVLPILAEAYRPIGGSLNGIGRFSSSESSDGKDVIYASVDCPDLTEFRTTLCEMLSIGEVPYKRTHGYTPHVTLKYIDTSESTPIPRLAPVPVSFGGLTLAVGASMETFPFGRPAIQGEPENYAADIAGEIRSVVKSLPEMMPGYGNVYLNRKSGEVWIEAGDSDEGDAIRAWEKAISSIDGVKKVSCECEYVPRNILESVKSGGEWAKVVG